jgi:hypothetical protein
MGEAPRDTSHPALVPQVLFNHALSFEFSWHAIFGEPWVLPVRAPTIEHHSRSMLSRAFMSVKLSASQSGYARARQVPDAQQLAALCGDARPSASDVARRETARGKAGVFWSLCATNRRVPLAEELAESSPYRSAECARHRRRDS